MAQGLADVEFLNTCFIGYAGKRMPRFGKPDATENEIVAAAKAACCHDFIIAMPDGYDTMVGEGGSSLSGKVFTRILCRSGKKRKAGGLPEGHAAPHINVFLLSKEGFIL